MLAAHRAIRVLAASVWLAFVLILGCSNEPPQRAVAATIGPEGGVVAGPDGASVTVPSGAVDVPTKFGIAVADGGFPELPGSIRLAGRIFAFTPHGASFELPVIVRVPFAAEFAEHPELGLYTAELGGQWERVSNASADGSALEAEVQHFSFFAAAVPADAADAGAGGADGGVGGSGSGGDGGCVPETCSGLDYQCGSVPDGCGGTLECGSCAGSEVCGGSGTPGACGPPCGGGCPPGFECRDGTVCAGGELGALKLDFATPPVPVTGRITKNGEAVGLTCASPGPVLWFRDRKQGELLPARITCEGPDWQFDAALRPGTWDALFTGDGRSLPATDALIEAAAVLEDGGPQQVDLDFGRVVYAGTVTKNGARPQGDCVGAVVTLSNALGSVSAAIDCSSLDWTFSTAVYADTYEVRYGDFDLPHEQVIHAALALTESRHSEVIDLSVPRVTGTIRVNGEPLACNPLLGRPRLKGTFVRSDGQVLFGADCVGGNVSFAATLEPGTYDIVLSSSGEGLPDASGYVARRGLEVGSSDIDDLVIDVPVHRLSGGIRLNGVAPTEACGSRAVVPEVGFVSVDGKMKARIPVDCASAGPWRFSGSIFPGTWRVFVPGGYDEVLGHDRLVARSSYSATQDDLALELDAGTMTLSGEITATGAEAGCVAATLAFYDDDNGGLARRRVDCGSYSVELSAGTWRVEVADLVDGVPDDWFADAPVSVTAGQDLSRDWDVPVATVSGALTVNGQQPAGTCPLRTMYLRNESGSGTWFACNDGTWTFGGSIFPGEWAVDFHADSGFPLAPSYMSYERSFSFLAGANSVVFDLPVRTISGELTRDGAPIGSPCIDSSPTVALLTLENRGPQGGSGSHELELDCSGPNWTFSGLIYPGAYQVWVSGDGEHLPHGRRIAVPRLEVP